MNLGKSINELSRMDGRVSLVIGGAGHIGSVAASGLAELGSKLAIVDINEDRVRAVADEIRQAHGVEVLEIVADLESEAEVRSIPTTVNQHFGRIDVLVHLAAIVNPELGGWTTRFEDQSVTQWRRGIEINLTSAFLLAQGCVESLRKSPNGSMIFFGSTYGIVGPDWSIYEGTDMGNAAGYAASKGGIIQLTRWLATTLAPEVRVNTLSPGGVYRDHLEVFRNAYANKTPLKRMATEEDYKAGVAFLASDMSRYVTGHNLVIDGGWTAW
ncbi:MAG: SDR family oxidoreductase [Candidatus Nanopelagicaceae bacterium]|jgi:NAD(P)-dependent dehydrogenase (short-subunit alcohol dehydrogenase family)